MKALIGPWDGEGNRDISIELDAYDTWNVDYTLAVVAAPLLRQLRSRSHSYGLVDPDDVPTDIPTDDKYGTMESWHWVMDEMIWAFEYKAKDMDAGDMCADKCANFGDPVCEACLNETQERLTNAFKLFGKYYENLWD